MIHRLYSSSAGDAVVTWICPEDTSISHVRWVNAGLALVDGGTTKWELSFNAVQQHTVNDVVNVIDSAVLGVEITTSGGLRSDMNELHEIPGGVPVEAGEKVYLHVTSTNGVPITQCYVYTTARRASKSSTRRR